MTGDDVFHADQLGMGRFRRVAISGAISDPRASTLDRRRFEYRWPKIIAVIFVVVLAFAGWALTIACLWGLKTLAALLLRWAEPAAAIIGVGVALAVIAYGIGMPG